MTEEVTVPTDVEVLDKVDDFLHEIPEDWDECMELIKSNMSVAIKKSVTLYWYTGRILYSLKEKDKDYLKKAVEATGYGERTLYSMMAAYREYPSYKTLTMFIQHCISWSSIKELARLKEDTDKEDAVKRISDGELNSEDVPDYVQNLLEPPKEESPETGDNDTEEGEEDTEEKDTATDDKDEAELFNWFVKLRDHYIETRTNMKVELSDIGTKIDQMDDTTKTDDSTYQKCVGVLEEVKAEADKNISYWEQIKNLIETR